MNTPVKNHPNDDYVISFLNLRKAIGVLGLALPLVMVVGHYLAGLPIILPDLSSYYHGPMRDIFVGILCATAVFSFAYRGPERKDDIAGDLVAVFALGVAFFPGGQLDPNPHSTIAIIHTVAAALFYLTLAYFCLVLFIKTGNSPTQRKYQRNKVYRIGGYSIVLSLILIGVYRFWLVGQFPSLATYHPVFWLEVIAQVGFGVAWLVKGETMLADLPR